MNIRDTLNWKGGVYKCDGGRENTTREKNVAMKSIDDGWGFFCSAKCRNDGLEEAKILMFDEPVSVGDVFAVLGRETGLFVINRVAIDACSRRNSSSFPVIELNETTIRNAMLHLRSKRGKGAE